MSKIGNATKKVLAAVLTMLLVFGMVPVSAIPASAATTEYPEAVTVTVKDGEGNPVSDAEVSFAIIDDADVEIKNDKVTTNANGSAEVIAKADYKDGLTIKGTVTKTGYDSAVINEAITSDDKDIIVTIKTKEITDVTVTKVSRTVEVNDALELVAGDAVIITGLKEDDEVSYQINGKNSEVMPKISKVGTYNVTVVVKRTGYEIFTETVTSEITEKKVYIDAEIIAGLTYTGEAQTLVKINNAEDLKNKYGVTLDVKNNVATDAGVYTVTINGDSSVEGIVVEEKTIEAKIDPIKIKSETAEITMYNAKYDGEAHPAVESVVLKNGIEATVMYKVGDGEWSKDCPMVKNAGETIVKINVIPKDAKNYKGEVFARKAIVSQSENREFKFEVEAFNAEASKSNAEVVTKDGEAITINKSYNFEAKAAEQDKKETVKYKVEAVGSEGKATINEKGLLTVTEPGTFKVTATIAENDNYTKAEISHEINVRAVPKNTKGERVAFVDFGETAEKDYFVNKNNLVVSDVAAKLTVKAADNSNVTYKMFAVDSQKPFSGIACDATTGKVYITSIDAFIAYLNRAGGNLQVKVVATKSEGALTIGDTDSYIINIQYPNAPESLFTLAMSLTSTGWISSEVTVNPVEGYTVAKARKYGQDTTIISHEEIEIADDAEQIKASLSNAFKNNVKFGDDGQNHRSVYLCDSEGYIYAPIDVKVNFNGVMQDLKIDRTNPDAGSMKISYSTEKNSIVDKIKTLFYKDTVTLTLEATDKLSGVQRFTCEYAGKEIPVENFTSIDGKSAEATATITIAEGEEYKSKVSFKAYDRAGNVTQKTGDETVIIDYVSPEMTVEYVNPVNVVPDGETTPKTYYFNEKTPLVYKVRVKETNGFEVNGTITVLKDGKVFDDATVKYERLGGYDVYTVTVPSTEENQGVYTVEASYTDKSTNKMVVDGVAQDKFVSDEMVIDVTNPAISFEYNENKKHDGEPCDDYAVTLKVTEVNFDAKDFVATVEARDIKENTVAVDKLNNYIKDNANWKLVDNKYECVLTYGANGILPDANYGNINFGYTDLAKNHVVIDSKEFVIDTTAPSAPIIKYETSLWPVIAEVLTMGLSDEIVYKYFNAPTTITLTSTDATWGVDGFVLTYNREKGESKTNVEKLYVDVKATQSEKDKDVFTAQVTLPKEEADQLRGSMTAYAIDKHGIKSDTVKDTGTVIIVDDIAPEISVAYSEAQRTVTEKNKAYYNNDIVGTITVTEANFYAEDVVLSVIRDGVEIATPAIEWTGTVDAEGNKEDVYKGTFTLPTAEDHSTDGDYIVKVSYTDRSTNEAVAYESDILVIDTTAPVISVTYENTDPVNTLKDINGIKRDYFAGKQIATITITEHNFKSGEVKLPILEQDVSGDEVTKTRVESEWISDGDVHTLTITYPGDANYTFDIEYTDLATNAATDYTPDYFTVDNTAPKLTVKQINRVATTVLNNITFGYFGGAKDKNAKAEVEVTVEDDISFANVVTATYNQTEGTSSVNKRTETQTADADKIKISEDGKTATTTFKLPVTVLKTDKKNMHGAVDFVALDRAGNSSANNKETKSVTGVIVDNISPKAKIELSKPYTTENNIAYYDGNITGTITVTEANFDNPEDFYFAYSKDGAKNKKIPLKWTHKNVNTHVATFTITQDGDYILTANYKDKATNEMATYKSNQLTIDTKINAPVITFQGNSNDGLGFNDEVIPGVKFEDDNYKSYQITLTRTRYDEKNVDVKGEFIGNRVVINANGGSGVFDTFEDIRENDGVYTLTVKMTDKVNHSSTTSRTFVVNRYGSVYVYNDALVNLIDDDKEGSRYVTDVKEDLVITEYNANKLKEGTLQIDITRDGRPVDEVLTSTAPVKNNGWYEYSHTINRENFNTEGLYKISVSSTDEVNNDTDNKEGKNTLDKKFAKIEDVLWFKVDKKLPSITDVTIDQESSNYSEYTEINADKANIEFTVYDAIGIAKVQVVVDGVVVETFEGEDFGDDINNFTGSFALSRNNSRQSVKILVTDLSGRVLDTSKEDEAKDSIPDNFFKGKVLVTTNIFAQFWNNQPVFWGVVGGTLGAAALIILLIVLKKRKKKDEK